MNSWDLDPNSYLLVYLGGRNLLRLGLRQIARTLMELKHWAYGLSRPCRYCGSNDICLGVDCMDCELRGTRRELLGHEYYFPGPYVF